MDNKNKLRRLEPKSKVWLELDGQPVFGDGKAKLLQAINNHRSIRGAAQSMRLSYRAAWGKLREMEQRLGARLVERHSGGADGGGASLTPTGKELLAAYERFYSGVAEMVDEHFRQRFFQS